MATEQKKDQQPLPEEKLLKVIQGKAGGAKAGEGVTETKTLEVPPAAASRPAAPVPPASSSQQPRPAPAKPAASATVSAEKPKPALKLGKTQKDAPAPAAKQRSVGRIEAKPASFQVVSAIRRTRPGITISTVNRILGFVSGLFLLLTAWEVAAAVRNQQLDRGPVAVSDAPSSAAPSQGGGNAEPASNDLEKITIFQPPPAFTQIVSTGTQAVVEWQMYAKDNLNMIGLSGSAGAPGREAIVFDKKLNKMHILKVGNKMTLAQREVIVETIDAEDIVLSDGRQKITLK